MSKFLDENGLQYFWSKLKTSLSNKVDKITGKGLSTNDYTTAEKTKLAGIDTNATAVGKNVTGTSKQIDGSYVIAKLGAEIFNDYGSNFASGTYSHAEGLRNLATGSSSHAEGESNIASGSCSHAEGYLTQAQAQDSHAEGYKTIADSQYQHVQGKCNISDSNNKYAFIIGNGTSSSNRSNAFAVDWNGLIYINNASTGIDITELESRITALETTVNNINTILEEVL